MATKTKNEAAPFGGVLYGPDASRAATWSAPLRVCPGRGIVDARGRLIAQAVARRSMGEDGEMRETFEPAGLAPVEADSNAHAIAHALNLAAAPGAVLQSLRDLVRVIRECYESDDPHGALDRIAEHADGAEQIMAAAPGFVDAARVATFRANLAHAIRNRETVTVGGGTFDGDELRAVMAALGGDA